MAADEHEGISLGAKLIQLAASSASSMLVVRDAMAAMTSHIETTVRPGFRRELIDRLEKDL